MVISTVANFFLLADSKFTKNHSYNQQKELAIPPEN